MSGDNKGLLYGPLSLPELAKASPTIADDTLRAKSELGAPVGDLLVPIMFAGDPEPATVAKVNYSPSDADCIADVPHTLEAIKTTEEIKK
jgi:hypothetical protein